MIYENKFERRNMRRCLLLVFVLAVLGCTLVGCPPQREMATTIKVTPSKPVVLPGDSFNVDISVEPASGVNVAGMQLDFGFNPQAVRVDSVVEGNLLKQGGASTYFQGGTVDNQTGVVKNVVGVITTPGQSVTAPGIFVTLGCTALASGKPSDFVLSNVVIGNKDAVAIPFDSPVINQVVVTVSCDLDLDGLVNIADLIIVAAALGLVGVPGFTKEDTNLDSVVNVLDMILVGQSFS